MLFLMYIYSGARIFKFVFLGGVRKKEITRISRCVWGVWLFQVFNLKTITVNPIVYGYRIINCLRLSYYKERDFFTCSAP